MRDEVNVTRHKWGMIRTAANSFSRATVIFWSFTYDLLMARDCVQFCLFCVYLIRDSDVDRDERAATNKRPNGNTKTSLSSTEESSTAKISLRNQIMALTYSF